MFLSCLQSPQANCTTDLLFLHKASVHTDEYTAIIKYTWLQFFLEEEDRFLRESPLSDCKLETDVCSALRKQAMAKDILWSNAYKGGLGDVPRTWLVSAAFEPH